MGQSSSAVYPNVADPYQGKTRQSSSRRGRDSGASIALFAG